MADNEEQEQQVSSSSALFSDLVHHYQAEPETEPELYTGLPLDEQPKEDLFSLDDIVDLVGGAQDALERHMAEDGEPHGFTEPHEEEPDLLDPQPDPVPHLREEQEQETEEDEQLTPDSSDTSSFRQTHSLSDASREAEPQVCPVSDALPAAPATQPAAPSPAHAAQTPADTQPARAPVSYAPSSPSKPQPLMQFPTDLGKKGGSPAPISPLSPLHSPDSLEELSLTESPNQPYPPGSALSQGSFCVRSKEMSWEDDQEHSGPGLGQDEGELHRLTGPYLSLGKDPGPQVLCEDSGVSFSPEEKHPSSELSPATPRMVVKSDLASSNPTEHRDSPLLGSQDDAEVPMDSFSKVAAAIGSPGYESEPLGNPSDEDDDLMYETKKNNNPFDGFSPLADSASYNFGQSRSDPGAAEVSDSPTPDLVHSRQSEELRDSPPSFLDEGKPFESGTKAVGHFSSDLEEEDEEEEEDPTLPPSLPDILKSSPLNPDKMDSGSSEGSPDEQSPILERRMMESPNPPINLSANNPFALDAKMSLLQEMADEMEVKGSDKAKDEEVKRFGAFDLLKEAEETTPAQQKDWFSSHLPPEVTGTFEPVEFESRKAPAAEESDSESATADSLSPVLEAMAKNPASFQVEKKNTKVELEEEPELADEVSEHEVSSEEFEFIERPPKGVIDEFLEALDTSKFAAPKACPEIPVDEVRSFERLPASAPVLPEMAAEDPSQSSYLLLTQSSSQKSKADPDPDQFSVREPAFQTARPNAAVRKPEEALAQESGKAFRMPRVNISAVVDLLYWRDVKTTGVVFGAVLLLLLSLTACSIVSVCSYVGLALLSVTVCFRIYKGVLQAIQKSDEGHPFKQYLEREVTLSEDVVHKYSDVLLERINKTVSELRRLFLVEDLVDSIKFAVLMWVLTYVGALFNGLTLVILAVIGAFSCPIIYEKHQAQIDRYLALVNNQIKDIVGKIQAKVPGMKRKAE
ncbi:reticulon-4-like isoform X2 [Hippocampus zosterae]|uniref:reticulon-4-like isoform X2 n=1 Tax=Hippocampus zosterae TaxID=109293 RepID=UPI00223DB633|nr:reticulon-4-like isoform X2 [Hippocampus zosterae]